MKKSLKIFQKIFENLTKKLKNFEKIFENFLKKCLIIFWKNLWKFFEKIFEKFRKNHWYFFQKIFENFFTEIKNQWRIIVRLKISWGSVLVCFLKPELYTEFAVLAFFTFSLKDYVLFSVALYCSCRTCFLLIPFDNFFFKLTHLGLTQLI